MRPDQLHRLKMLSEKICETVLVDADPDNWSGQGRLPKEMTKEERGNDLWCRKQASAGLALLTQVTRLTDPDSLPAPLGELDLDKEIARAEAEARKILERLNLHH